MGTLYIFDFDDTLVSSDASIRVKHMDGAKTEMSSEEYAKYTSQIGDEFDFSDFDAYPKNAEMIEPVFAELRSAIALEGPGNVVILTARSNPSPVKAFLEANRIPRIDVVAVGSPNPYEKANYILDRVKDDRYDQVVVFEDNARNIRSIRKVLVGNKTKITTNRVQNGKIVDTVTERHIRNLMREIK